MPPLRRAQMTPRCINAPCSRSMSWPGTRKLAIPERWTAALGLRISNPFNSYNSYRYLVFFRTYLDTDSMPTSSKQRETGVQPVDAQHIRAAALEAAGVRRRLPVQTIIVAPVFDHMPTELLQPQSVRATRPGNRTAPGPRAPASICGRPPPRSRRCRPARRKATLPGSESHPRRTRCRAPGRRRQLRSRSSLQPGRILHRTDAQQPGAFVAQREQTRLGVVEFAAKGRQP